MKRMPRIFKTICIGISLALITAGAGCRPMERNTMYRLACESIKVDYRFPAGAVLEARKEALIYDAKNAACVIIPYAFTDVGGKRQTHSYTVWLKRIGRRWEVDRCFPTPSGGEEDRPSLDDSPTGK